MPDPPTRAPARIGDPDPDPDNNSPSRNRTSHNRPGPPTSRAEDPTGAP
nr:hypothetical protein OG461_00650 [Streptomyces sp. NBC_00995]WSW71136.1 hypothetical protein OG461_35890 [Streptomyces sp. NBC_00995]